MEPLGGKEAPSLTKALNRDALEEVFLHCSPEDLLALRATCSAAADLLDSNEKVWLSKLRESFGLNLKALAADSDALFVRLARRVFEASRAQQLRFQGVFVNGGVDEDAMHYFVDNLFRADKAPYCSNCSRDADCIALLLDGEVPRDAEFARVRQYMIRRCRYAAALILNVQMPEHGRDPDDIMHILEDWTDMQLEGFFKDLVSAMQAEHALGRLLVFDIPHERLAAEEQKILGVHQWLLDRPKAMKAAMLKPGGDGNAMLDTSVLPKLTAQGGKRLAGVVHEVSLSRVGNLTCPVSAGAVVVGSIDHSKVAGWAPEEVLALLQAAACDPACTALNGMVDAVEVQRAAAEGLLPPIVATDQTLAGVWHEFDTTPAAAQAAAAAAQGVGTSAQHAAVQQQKPGQHHAQAGPSAAPAAPADAEAGPSSGADQQVRASAAGIVTWKPLLWFKFHSVDESNAFVYHHRQLVEQHGSQATVRHHGPPPTRRCHVPAQEGEQLIVGPSIPWVLQHPGGPIVPLTLEQMQQHLQQGQQQQQQQQQGGQALQQGPAPHHPQQAVAVGVPAAWQPYQHGAAAAAAAGVPLQPGLPPAAGGVLAVGMPPAPASTDGEEDEEGSSDEEGGSQGADTDMGEDDSDGSGSDIDEAAEAQGAWLNHWAQDEFGADLQQQEQDVVVAGQGLPFDQMDEGSSSDGDDEGALEEHFELGLGGMDGNGVAGGAPVGGAAAAGQQQPVVQMSAAETLLRALTRRNTRARNRLRVPLSRPTGANIMLVKLISQENLMEQYGDPHTWPNIDMTLVELIGKLVELPPGVTLTP